MSIIHNTSVDFTRRVISEPVHIVQGDRTLPTLAVELLSDGQPYTVPDGAQVNIALNKKDGTFVLNKADSVDGNIATFTITAQMAAVPGDFTPEVQVIEGSGQATTGKFPYIVDKAEIQEGMIESTSEGTALIAYVSRAEEAAEKAEKVQSQIDSVTVNTEAAEKAATDAAASATAAATSQTSAKAYYEGTQRLAETVSGNVGIDDSTATLGTTYSSHKIEDKTRTNLFNPIAPTQTINGITFTNNGDGTYTVNGTAGSRDVDFFLARFNGFSILENTKLVGCPTGGTDSTYRLYLTCYNGSTWLGDYVDRGDGVIVSNIPSKTSVVSPHIVIKKGITVNNLIFKPMLTTDLSATYDDFVQYSGNNELNENVAEMYKEIQNLKNAITELGGTV